MRVAAISMLITTLVFAGRASAQIGIGDAHFLGSAMLTIERCSGDCYRPADRHFAPVNLTAKQLEKIRSIVVRALHRNHRHEVAAARHHQISGGVPGVVTYEHRLIFSKGGERHDAWLHIGSTLAWLEGEDERIGDVVFDAHEIATLKKLLEH